MIYRVKILREVYQSAWITVEASNPDEAEEVALVEVTTDDFDEVGFRDTPAHVQEIHD